MLQIAIIILGIFLWVVVQISESISNQKSKNETIKRKKQEIEAKFGNRILNKELSLVERNKDIIQMHLKQISAGYQNHYYIDNCVRDCIDEIANAEGDFDMAPGYEYLSVWSKRANKEYTELKNILLEKFKNKKELLDQKKTDKENRETKNKLESLELKHTDLINQFFEITERKVSIIDDYGDENWEELPKQIDLLINKIAKKERYSDDEMKEWKKYDFYMPDEIKLLKNKLEKDFKKYHLNHKEKHKNYSSETIDKMSGTDFETYLSKKLKDLGYEVSGTKTTGDQGADLIAKRGGKKIIIQAKRYSGSVGNKAVQEVIGAINYYEGTSGCVITNSTFTPAAKALAQKNKIMLIDGHDLKTIETKF